MRVRVVLQEQLGGCAWVGGETDSAVMTTRSLTDESTHTLNGRLPFRNVLERGFSPRVVPSRVHISERVVWSMGSLVCCYIDIAVSYPKEENKNKKGTAVESNMNIPQGRRPRAVGYVELYNVKFRDNRCLAEAQFG